MKWKVENGMGIGRKGKQDRKRDKENEDRGGHRTDDTTEE